MKNFVQRGESLDLTAPAGGLVAGQAHLFGALFGVAFTNIPAGEKGAVATVGVFTLPKATDEALTEGAAAYWNGTAVTGDPSGNTPIGHVVETAATADTTAVVRISN